MIRSLYVHAPFCAHRCFYCGFPVTVSPAPDPTGWLSALERELERVQEEGFFTLAEELDTLFVGGGTPSVLGPHAMKGLAGMVGDFRLGGSGLEWTAEANPESFSPEVAEGWASAGVNRLSFGVQSFQEGALRWLQRRHGPEAGRRAVDTARTAGITNISVDLIFGLPREVRRDWTEDLDTLLSLGVPHVSLYGLSIEKDTRLFEAVEAGQVSVPDEEEYREQFLEAGERLTTEGYRHYEVSNFCLPGHEARHNRVYWESKPYLGLGNGAHSFRFPRRRWNLRGWGDYQRKCLLGEAPWESEEELTEGEFRLEQTWLGLRTDQGVPWENLESSARVLAGAWVDRGLAFLEEGALRLTPGGWLFLDELTVELDLARG